MEPSEFEDGKEGMELKPARAEGVEMSTSGGSSSGLKEGAARAGRDAVATAVLELAGGAFQAIKPSASHFAYVAAIAPTCPSCPESLALFALSLCCACDFGQSVGSSLADLVFASLRLLASLLSCCVVGHLLGYIASTSKNLFTRWLHTMDLFKPASSSSSKGKQAATFQDSTLVLVRESLPLLNAGPDILMPCPSP
jgi:hypothetical protein